MTRRAQASFAQVSEICAQPSFVFFRPNMTRRAQASFAQVSERCAHPHLCLSECHASCTHVSERCVCSNLTLPFCPPPLPPVCFMCHVSFPMCRSVLFFWGGEGGLHFFCPEVVFPCVLPRITRVGLVSMFFVFESGSGGNVAAVLPERVARRVDRGAQAAQGGARRRRGARARRERRRRGARRVTGDGHNQAERDLSASLRSCLKQWRVSHLSCLKTWRPLPPFVSKCGVNFRLLSQNVASTLTSPYFVST